VILAANVTLVSRVVLTLDVSPKAKRAKASVAGAKVGSSPTTDCAKDVHYTVKTASISPHAHNVWLARFSPTGSAKSVILGAISVQGTEVVKLVSRDW